MKFSLALILVLAVASQASVRTRRVGRHNGRVTNGIQAAVGQFPFQADVQGDGLFEGMCAGALIAPDWVLTDAICITTGTIWTVTVGMTVRSDTGDGRQVRTSTQGFMHPDYDFATYANELGAIKLPTAVTFGANVMPVTLPTRTEAGGDYVGSSGTVAGWGINSDALPEMSDNLMYVTLSVTDNAICSGVYGSDVIDGDKLCAASAFPSSPCTNDDGAPFVTTDNKLIGIYLFSQYNGCEVDDPTFYIRIASWLDWIETTTGITILP